MKAITYTSPEGTEVRDPSPEFLERIIFRERGRYWRLGSGDSRLTVEDHRRKRSRRLTDGEPALAFFLVERHGFFFTYFEPGKFIEQFVPFAGGPSRPRVRHPVGGLAMYVPRGSFVSRAFGWEVVQEFLRTNRRSQSVRWVKRSVLEFPDPEATRLSKADLA